MKRWSCRYFLNLEKQKTNLLSVSGNFRLDFWKIGKKKKKNLSLGFHFLRKSCAMKEERRRFTFSIIIHRKFQKKKKKNSYFFFFGCCCCCCCACAVSKKGPETFCHNLINPRAGTSKHCTV